MWVIVYRNDARVIGLFHSQAAAERWISAVPNILFKTTAEVEHADLNADFFIAQVEVY